MIDYAANRFGTAKWSMPETIRSVGLHHPKGLQFGYMGDNPLYVEGDASAVTIAGAGAGKGNGVLMYNVLNYDGPMFVHDPKGELAAVALHNQHKLGIRAYCINPFELHNLPNHKCNPLDILTPDSLSLASDALDIVENLLPASGQGDNEFFITTAQRWLTAMMMFEVLETGKTSFTTLQKLVSWAEAEPDKFEIVMRKMRRVNNPDVQRSAGEMSNRKLSSNKQFGSFLSFIYNALKFMIQKPLRDTLKGNDFSLSALCNDKKPCKVFFIIPVEHMKVCAPMTRAMFAVSMKYKSRIPQSRRIVYLIDEAAQLGNFPSLLWGYEAGRGYGIKIHSIWQNLGQMSKIYGPEAETIILSCSQVRQFFGVRDIETAELLSKMLGSMTLEYDEKERQQQSEYIKKMAASSMISGGNTEQVSMMLAQGAAMQQVQEKQVRSLLMPDEIMRLPHDRQILFVSEIPGLEAPILANKYPYYTRKELVGKFLNNPYHPPTDSVEVSSSNLLGKSGTKLLRIEQGDAPREYMDWPQFDRGYRYVKGYG